MTSYLLHVGIFVDDYDLAQGIVYNMSGIK